jgi:hypothetical protein
LADRLPSAEAIAVMRDLYAALTAASHRDVTEEFGLDRFAFSNICVTMSALPWGGCDVEVSYRAPERDTGATHRFSRRIAYRSTRRPTTVERAQIARCAVLETLLHELDETIEVDGIRVFDPHRSAPRWRLPRVSPRAWIVLASGWAASTALRKVFGWGTEPTWWWAAAPICVVLGVVALIGIVRAAADLWRFAFAGPAPIVPRRTLVMARYGAANVDGDGRPIDG